MLNIFITILATLFDKLITKKDTQKLYLYPIKILICKKNIDNYFLYKKLSLLENIYLFDIDVSVFIERKNNIKTIYRNRLNFHTFFRVWFVL